MVLDAGTEWGVQFVEGERSWRIGEASGSAYILFSNAINPRGLYRFCRIRSSITQNYVLSQVLFITRKK